MSDEHRWYQQEIAKQALRRRELRVVVEDYESNGDVLIVNVETNRSIVIEIQRWNTDISARTEHRLLLGHEVIWLITDVASLSPEMKHQIFMNRGAFVRVRSFDKPHRELKPWEPEQPRTTPVIEVSGTIGRLEENSGCIRSARMPLMTIIREILDGKRDWRFPGEAVYKSVKGEGRKGGCWIRNIDYVNAWIMESGVDIPLQPETSLYGRLSDPLKAPLYIPQDY